MAYLLDPLYRYRYWYSTCSTCVSSSVNIPWLMLLYCTGTGFWLMLLYCTGTGQYSTARPQVMGKKLWDSRLRVDDEAQQLIHFKTHKSEFPITAKVCAVKC